MFDLTTSSSESEASSGQNSISCEPAVMIAAQCSTEQSASLCNAPRSFREGTGLVQSSVDNSSTRQWLRKESFTTGLSNRSGAITGETFLGSNVPPIGVLRQHKSQRANNASEDGHSKDTHAKKISLSPAIQTDPTFEVWVESIMLIPSTIPIDSLTRFIPIGIGCWIFASSALYALPLIVAANRDPLHLYRAIIIPSPLIAIFCAVKLSPRVKDPELRGYLFLFLFLIAGVYVLTYLVFAAILTVKLYGRLLWFCISLIS